MITAFCIATGWDNKKYNLIDKELYDAFMDRHKESNNQVAKEFLNRDQLFLEEYVEKEITAKFDVDNLKASDIIRLMVVVLAKVLKFSIKIFPPSED